MKQFGSVVGWHGDTMVAPRKYWGSIQELAYSAGGEATEVGNEQGVAEGETKYDAEWDEKVQRLGQMAKQGPHKTVWDSVKRVYKTVPVNTSKKDSPAKETKDVGSIAASKPGYSGEANYTAQANWRGQNIGEDWETDMTRAVLKLIESQIR
jgi:hypothetical protein